MSNLDQLLSQVRACAACGDLLPLGPKPILQISAASRILIASQAPGTKAHASGVPFSDPSGKRLREWMGISETQFCDASHIAILPMGLCYPGRARHGDAPPRAECAPLWRAQLLAAMPNLRLTLLVGSYAQNHVLGAGQMTERVRHCAAYLPSHFLLPHPSWRVTAWAKKHPWFEGEVLPRLRAAIQQAL